MAEWLKAADCKSVPEGTVVRIHPCPPESKFGIRGSKFEGKRIRTRAANLRNIKIAFEEYEGSNIESRTSNID